MTNPNHFSSRTEPSVFTSIAPVSDQSNKTSSVLTALKSTSHFLPQSRSLQIYQFPVQKTPKYLQSGKFEFLALKQALTVLIEQSSTIC